MAGRTGTFLTLVAGAGAVRMFWGGVLAEFTGHSYELFQSAVRLPGQRVRRLAVWKIYLSLQ